MKKIRLLPFGGRLLKNSNAKTARRLCATSWTKVVLEARDCNFERANRLKVVHQVLKSAARKAGIQLENPEAEGKRISFLVRLRRKKNFAPFIRHATGALALKISAGSKRNPLQQSFWICRPWTCVVEKLKALFGPQSFHQFNLDFELSELLRVRLSEGILILGP